MLVDFAASLENCNSEVPAPGLEDVVGKTEDEVTPECLKRVEAYMREQFKAAGIDYPADDLAHGANSL